MNGIAFGPDGRLYIAHLLAGQISAVDVRTGQSEIVVKPGGPIRTPDDLAFAPDGTMYVTDTVPGKIWRVDGEPTLVADDVRAANGIAFAGERLFVNEMVRGGRLLEIGGEVLTDGLAMGNAMQLGPDGYLYYPHMMSGEVWRISPDGGTPELVADEIPGPVAVRFDRDGDLIVLAIGAAGPVTRISGDRRTSMFTGIDGLDNAAFDDDNRMYVSSYATGALAEVLPDGRTRRIVPPRRVGPFGVAVDARGSVHAADHYRLDDAVLHRGVHGVAADGTLTHITSQYGLVRTYDPSTGSLRVRASGLDRPLGIAVRADGQLVVAEAGAGRIVAISASDSLTVLADGFERPVDVAFDASGSCYVTDEAAGTVSRLGDDAPLLDGLDVPQGLAVRGSSLFVVETGTRQIRAVDLDTGAVRVVATDLGVVAGGASPMLFCHGAPGIPGLPGAFAGLAAGPDGELYLAANRDGEVVRIDPGTDQPAVIEFSHLAAPSVDVIAGE